LPPVTAHTHEPRGHRAPCILSAKRRALPPRPSLCQDPNLTARQLPLLRTTAPFGGLLGRVGDDLTTFDMTCSVPLPFWIATHLRFDSACDGIHGGAPAQATHVQRAKAIADYPRSLSTLSRNGVHAGQATRSAVELPSWLVATPDLRSDAQATDPGHCDRGKPLVISHRPRQFAAVDWAWRRVFHGAPGWPDQRPAVERWPRRLQGRRSVMYTRKVTR
jgi:hypothetical protein